MHALDQNFRRFLEKQLEVDSSADVGSSFFGMTCITQSVVHPRFSLDLLKIIILKMK